MTKHILWLLVFVCPGCAFDLSHLRWDGGAQDDSEISDASMPNDTDDSSVDTGIDAFVDIDGGTDAFMNMDDAFVDVDSFVEADAGSDVSCLPLTTDASAIGQVRSVCPTGYVRMCDPTCFCQIPCEQDCECPSPTTCRSNLCQW